MLAAVASQPLAVVVVLWECSHILFAFENHTRLPGAASLPLAANVATGYQRSICNKLLSLHYLRENTYKTLMFEYENNIVNVAAWLYVPTTTVDVVDFTKRIHHGYII